MASTGGGYFPGELFDTARARWAEQDVTGAALATARADRGHWLTDAEKLALAMNVRWGADSYPVLKVGRNWILEHPAAKGTPLYRTKRAAVVAWEILISAWTALKGLEAANVVDTE